MLCNKTDIVLMADGKLVTKGLKESFVGDVNLFGHETSPHLDELKSTLESHITYIGRCSQSFKECNYADQYEILLELLQMNTQLLSKIRAHNSVQRKKLSNFTEIHHQTFLTKQLVHAKQKFTHQICGLGML